MDKPTYTRPQLREVPRHLVAARLAAAIIRQMDSLTAEQVGTIAHTLGMAGSDDGGGIEHLLEADPLDVDHLRYLGKLHAQGIEYRPFSSQAGVQTFGGIR